MRASNIFLLAASLLFYAYGEPVYLFLMIGSAFMNWLIALLIDRAASFRAKKALLAVSISGNVLLLAVFKYAGFLTECVNAVFHLGIPVPAIRLPIGISFFTFQAMSYVIDVYRGSRESAPEPQTGGRIDAMTLHADRSFLRVLLYISFFPQLIAGPIVKYHDISEEMNCRSVSVFDVEDGLLRFTRGLCKKVLIANPMAVAADQMFSAEAALLSTPLSWVGAAAYFFQIYFDFSGYSDMALGLGRMFGFHFQENFSYPYAAGSIRQFWRRWHISLSSWFREYLYIPLGGNRNGRAKTVRNRFIVFALTGLWHGANVTFLFWGLYHGALLMLEELAPQIEHPRTKAGKAAAHIYTILAVMIGFVFFRAETMGQGWQIVRTMFGGIPHAVSGAVLGRSGVLLISLLTPKFLAAFAAACVFSTPVLPAVKRKFVRQSVGWTAMETDKDRSDRQFSEEAVEGRDGGKTMAEAGTCQSKGPAAAETGRKQPAAHAEGDILLNLLSLAALAVCMLELAAGSYNPFIYFRF